MKRPTAAANRNIVMVRGKHALSMHALCDQLPFKEYLFCVYHQFIISLSSVYHLPIQNVDKHDDKPMINALNNDKMMINDDKQMINISRTVDSGWINI